MPRAIGYTYKWELIGRYSSRFVQMIFEYINPIISGLLFAFLESENPEMNKGI